MQWRVRQLPAKLAARSNVGDVVSSAMSFRRRQSLPTDRKLAGEGFPPRGLRWGCHCLSDMSPAEAYKRRGRGVSAVPLRIAGFSGERHAFAQAFRRCDADGQHKLDLRGAVGTWLLRL